MTFLRYRYGYSINRMGVFKKNSNLPFFSIQKNGIEGLNKILTLMNATIWPWSFLLFFKMLIVSSATYGQFITDTKTDSLHTVIDKKTGSEKITSQLDLALQIINTDKDEAMRLANSALPAAKNIGNKNLEMRSYYMLGRIYTELENNELSLAYLDSALLITEATDDKWYKGEILFLSLIHISEPTRLR